MRMSQIPDLLETAHKAGISVFLKGAPGCGKTSAVRQYADKIKYRLISVHAPLTDPLDIKGLPTVENNEARFLPLSMWPQESDAPVVVLIDELPQCVPSIQNAYSQLLIDKQIGNLKLPKGSFVIATGNRKEDRAATSNIPSHIVNRVLHINVDTVAEDFLDWAVDNKIDPMVIGFGRWRPDCLHTFDPKNSQEPYATYRTWEMVSNFLKNSKHDQILYEALSGLIGEGPTSEFVAFKRLYLDLPDPKVTLANPELAYIPSDPATLYALTTAIASIINKDNADNLMVLAKRLPTEYAVLMVKTAHKLYADLRKCKAFQSWALENGNLIV